MTAHAHTTITPGCYRCELNLDEMEAIAEDCRITASGVVHDPDCHYVSRDTTHSMRWTKPVRRTDDQPCSRCLPDGLPVAVSA